MPTAVTFDAQNQTATIAIADLSSVSLPAAFTATIASTIADRAGNPLVQPDGAWSWSVPDWITFPRLESASRPIFAVGSDLLPVLEWTLFTYAGGTLNYQLQVAKYDGFGWTQLGPPSSNINSAGNGMDLSLDAENRPLAVWRETSADFQVAAWIRNVLGQIASPRSQQPSHRIRIQVPRLLRPDRVGRPVVMWREQAPSGRTQRPSWLAGTGRSGTRFDPIEVPAFSSRPT